MILCGLKAYCTGSIWKLQALKIAHLLITKRVVLFFYLLSHVVATEEISQFFLLLFYSQQQQRLFTSMNIAMIFIVQKKQCSLTPTGAPLLHLWFSSCYCGSIHSSDFWFFRSVLYWRIFWFFYKASSFEQTLFNFSLRGPPSISWRFVEY